MLRRMMFAVFIGLVACGMAFYVILFGSLMVMSLTHGANPAATPGLQIGLRRFVTPISVVVGIAVFLMVLKGLSRRARAQEEQTSNKAAM